MWVRPAFVNPSTTEEMLHKDYSLRAVVDISFPVLNICCRAFYGFVSDFKKYLRVVFGFCASRRSLKSSAVWLTQWYHSHCISPLATLALNSSELSPARPG